jgi:hypothetical protein
MSYAHQGVEIKQIPGLAPLDKPAQPAPVAQARPAGFEILNPAPASRLTRRGADALTALEEQLRAAPTKRADSVIELKPTGGPVHVVRSNSGTTQR